ncbi:phage baseplate assembly protein domain-containing protein [Roseomonas sp. F4]
MSSTRGTVTAARVRGGRTLLDLALQSGETVSRVELMQPTGLTALPRIGADVLVMEIGGRRGHLVALLADDTALRVLDLGPGETGVAGPGGQVVFRAGAMEVTATVPLTLTSTIRVVIDAPEVLLGAGATKRVALDGDPTGAGTVASSATKVFAE